MEIVPTGRAEIAVIRQLAQRTWPETFGEILSQAQIAYMLNMMYSTPSLIKQMEQDGHQFISVRDNGQYLGFASYELNYQGLNKTKVHKLYVLPESQGKGLGKLMLNHISEAGRQQGDKILSLNVNRDNQAVKFYEYLGFTMKGKQDISIGQGFKMEDYIMEKTI